MTRGRVGNTIGWFGLAVALGACGAEEIPVQGLVAEARDGQVFLTWREGDTPAGTTFQVYAANQRIVAVEEANRVGHHLERHSARDWWEDPASFDQEKPAGEPAGFLLRSGGQRLDPAGGLFVHTPKRGNPEELYFAVTAVDALGREDRRVVAGANATTVPVKTVPGPMRPIWQASYPEPSAGSAKDLALWLNLHAKGGVVPNMEYLAFGDASMGWREGLPFKFSVRIAGQELLVSPTDRVWINRPHREAADGGSPAIWTFWWGYSSKIYDRAQMNEGLPVNYTERRNLWLLGWVRSYYQPDMRRAYCSGSSMGGCGTVSFGLRHPELFVGLHARVPIVAYTYLGGGSAKRFEPCCWTGPIPESLAADDGEPFLERMNGTRFVERTREDLPMLFLIHGRQDKSIPWQNNPAFYRALESAHQAYAVYWDNGTHSTCGKEAPEDVKSWYQRFRKLRRDESYPAFGGTSSNANPGDGRPEDGDLVGWMNRGMDWRDIEDQPERYSLTVTADYPGIVYPVRTDVTLRRIQRFRPGAGRTVSARVDGRLTEAIERDSQGMLRILGVEIPSQQGVRIELQAEASAAAATGS